MNSIIRAATFIVGNTTWKYQTTSSLFKQSFNKLQTESQDVPIKFTSSKAHKGYKAIYTMTGQDDRELPDSHNYVVAGSALFGIFYLTYWRDEDDGGFKTWVKPLHETVPKYAIPMLKSALAENRRLGQPTRDIEIKLAQLIREEEEKKAAYKSLHKESNF